MINQENSKYDSLNQPVENKQQLAYQQIKQDILNNTYPAGTVMVERKLCEIYNVSRSPIRNALQQLTHEGLLSFVPGKGTVVASFSTDDILEVYDLIELLQDYAIKACINIFHFTRWDQKFHQLLVSYSGNKRLETVYDQLDCQQMLFISTILDDRDLAARSLQEHTQILDAIRNQDSDLAHQTLHQHYQHIKQYYINKLLSRIHI